MYNDWIEVKIPRRLCKGRLTFGIVGCWTPTGGIAGKNLNGGAAKLAGYFRCFRRVLSGRHMSTEAHAITLRSQLLEIHHLFAAIDSGSLSQIAAKTRVW